MTAPSADAERKLLAARRAGARLAAVQALYQIKGNNEPVALVIEEYRQHRLGQTDC